MAKKIEGAEAEKVVMEEPTYTKKQLLSSKKYARYKDLIQVLLKDDCYYTLDEVDSKINEFKKRRV